MGAHSPAQRYRWNIIIGPSCFTIPSNTTFFTEFLWHSCLWDHISFVFTALWDHISSTMLERFLNLHKMMVAVEQKTKQNGNIFLIVLMKSLSTKTIQLTRSIWAFHDQIAKKFLLNRKDLVAGSLEFYKNIRVNEQTAEDAKFITKSFGNIRSFKNKTYTVGKPNFAQPENLPKRLLLLHEDYRKSSQIYCFFLFLCLLCFL
jgi:hypothetical protein